MAGSAGAAARWLGLMFIIPVASEIGSAAELAPSTTVPSATVRLGEPDTGHLPAQET